MTEDSAASGADCAPEVERALIEGARIGVERDVAVLRHPDQGIRDPDSILDFSCLDDLFDFRRFDMLFDPGRSMSDLLGLVQRRICAAAREAYRGYVGRHLDASLYTAHSLRLPGLDPAGNSQRAIRAGNAERDRGVPSYRRAPLNQGRSLGPGRSPVSEHRGRRSMTAPKGRARPTIAAPKRVGMAWIVRGVCAAAVAAVAIAGASPAEALRCDRTDNDRAEASRAIRVLTGEIDDMERAIIEALRLQTGQLSGYAAQSNQGADPGARRPDPPPGPDRPRGGRDPHHERAPAEPQRVLHRHRRDGAGRDAERGRDHGQGCGRGGDRAHRKRPCGGDRGGQRRRRRRPLRYPDGCLLQRRACRRQDLPRR